MEVTGLAAITEFDPFENVEISLDGVAPYVEVSLEVKSEDGMYGELSYNIDKSSNLSNGDEVTITVDAGWYSDDINEYCGSNYGMEPSKTQMTYKIQGLGSYVAQLDSVSESTMTQMKNQVESDFNNYVSQNWSERATLDQMSYVGAYFLGKSDPESYTSYENMIKLVYQVDATIHYDADETDEEKEIKDKTSYFYCVTFYNLQNDSNGVTSVDLEDNSTVGNYFTKDVSYGDDFYDYDSYWFYGYETLDELKSSEVDYFTDSYTVQNQGLK